MIIKQKILRVSAQRWVGFIFLIFIFSTCKENHNDKIRVATAANMRSAMEELIQVYANKSGSEFELVVGSSGKLTAQILEGAPYDIFVAANMKYPEAVFHGGKSLNPPKVYADGQLVLWSMEDNTSVSIDELSNSNIEHIALANPKTAPYGLAALEVLQHYGINKTLAPKLVYGESIGQTDQFIISQAAQIGFTALSTVLSQNMRGKGRWVLLDPTLYAGINQGVVLVNRNGDSNPEAQGFYDFLFSKEAKEVLKEFGYLVNE